jgi:hypothetical protein
MTGLEIAFIVCVVVVAYVMILNWVDVYMRSTKRR